MFPRLSKDIVAASYPDMEITLFKGDLGREIYSMLPPLSEAIKLCDLYMEHGAYAWALYLLYMPQHVLTYIFTGGALFLEKNYMIHISAESTKPSTHILTHLLLSMPIYILCHDQSQRSHMLACDITSVCDICTRCLIRPGTTPIFDRITRILPLVACVSY